MFKGWNSVCTWICLDCFSLIPRHVCCRWLAKAATLDFLRHCEQQKCFTQRIEPCQHLLNHYFIYGALSTPPAPHILRRRSRSTTNPISIIHPATLPVGWITLLSIKTSNVLKIERVALRGSQTRTLVIICSCIECILHQLLQYVQQVFHLSSVQNPGWLFDIGGYTTQLYGDYFKETI